MALHISRRRPAEQHPQAAFRASQGKEAVLRRLVDAHRRRVQEGKELRGVCFGERADGEEDVLGEGKDKEGKGRKERRGKEGEEG